MDPTYLELIKSGGVIGVFMLLAWREVSRTIIEIQTRKDNKRENNNGNGNGNNGAYKKTAGYCAKEMEVPFQKLSTSLDFLAKTQSETNNLIGRALDVVNQIKGKME